MYPVKRRKDIKERNKSFNTSFIVTTKPFKEGY